jgi:DNA-binding SARP family transcriptional activator
LELQTAWSISEPVESLWKPCGQRLPACGTGRTVAWVTSVDEPAITLCGRLEVRLQGRNLTSALPGRQGRLVFAYLACNRSRAVSRDELIDMLWPSGPPASPEDVLGALLSKLRRVLGPGALEGRREVVLGLPADATIDLELAEAAIRHADSALGAGDGKLALDQARGACELLAGEFLPGYAGEWVLDRRRQAEELRLRGLELVARAGLVLAGGQLGAAEAAARELIGAEPLRERGYQLLMKVLAVRGEIAAALQAYEQLRVRLRDELGITPGAAIRAMHEQLLRGGEASHAPAPARPVVEAPATEAPVDEQFEATGRPEREERKVITVLAAEPAGVTGESDPEDLRATTTLAHERLYVELERFGATIEASTEGDVVALFGATISHEDDAERAVRAAVGLRDAGLVVRAGVATGEVLVTVTDRGAATAIGRPVREAVRIARRAPNGGVSVDGPTVEATPGVGDYEARDAGPTWLVSALRHQIGATREQAATTAFVGRAHELASLESMYESVVEEQRPRLAVLLGQAGVGKTRLVDEFVARIAVSSAPVIYRGRCLSYGEGITYWALREVLWAATGIELGDPAATAASKLRERVTEVVDPADADRVIAALAIASGITLPDNPLRRVSPGSVADEVALAWPAFLTGLAAARPVLVVIEDAHWAEEPLLQMVQLILARSAGPLLLVVTARPEFSEEHVGWTTSPGISQIGLEPLTERQSRALVAALLPNERSELTERVVATAEGNPLFAEELARQVSATNGQRVTVPNTVRALLTARVDALPNREKQALQDAAVVGRVFWPTTLESIDPRPDLNEALSALESRGLVVTRPRSSLPGETELSFRHGLVREVAYRSIPRGRRCRSHAAVGRWFEQLEGDRREEFVDLFAHHFEAASAPGDAALAWPEGSPEHEELQAKAVQALLEAGHGARKRMSLRQALRFAERAETLAVTDRERLQALELRARTHHAALHGADALSAYMAAIDIARALDDRDTLSKLRGRAILLCVRYRGAFAGESWQAQAVTLVEDGLAADGDRSGTFEGGALLLGRAWGLRRWTGRGDLAAAKRDAKRAIAIAETVDSPELLAAALEGLSWLVSEEGFCEAATMGERLIRATAGSSDRVEAHESKVTAAICFGWAGRFDRAAEVAREAMLEAPRLSPHRALHSALAQTFCLAPTGRFAELGQATDRVLESALEDAGDGQTCLGAIVGVAGRVLWLHETRQADASAAALELMNRVRPPDRQSIYDYFVAELLRPLLGAEATRTRLQRIQPDGQDATASILYLRAWLPVLALSGSEDELGHTAADAHRLAQNSCAPALGSIADWAAAARLALTDPEAARARARAAVGTLTEQGEHYTAARLDLDFALLTDGHASVEIAEDVAERFEAMGARASAALARAAVTENRPN